MIISLIDYERLALLTSVVFVKNNTLNDEISKYQLNFRLKSVEMPAKFLI